MAANVSIRRDSAGKDFRNGSFIIKCMMMAPIIAGLVWYYLYNSTFGWYHWLMQSLGILGEKTIAWVNGLGI